MSVNFRPHHDVAGLRGHDKEPLIFCFSLASPSSLQQANKPSIDPRMISSLSSTSFIELLRLLSALFILLSSVLLVKELLTEVSIVNYESHQQSPQPLSFNPNESFAQRFWISSTAWYEQQTEQMRAFPVIRRTTPDNEESSRDAGVELLQDDTIEVEWITDDEEELRVKEIINSEKANSGTLTSQSIAEGLPYRRLTEAEQVSDEPETVVVNKESLYPENYNTGAAASHQETIDDKDSSSLTRQILPGIVVGIASAVTGCAVLLYLFDLHDRCRHDPYWFNRHDERKRMGAFRNYNHHPNHLAMTTGGDDPGAALCWLHQNQYTDSAHFLQAIDPEQGGVQNPTLWIEQPPPPPVETIEGAMRTRHSHHPSGAMAASIVSTMSGSVVDPLHETDWDENIEIMEDEEMENVSEDSSSNGSSQQLSPLKGAGTRDSKNVGEEVTESDSSKQALDGKRICLDDGPEIETNSFVHKSKILTRESMKSNDRAPDEERDVVDGDRVGVDTADEGNDRAGFFEAIETTDTFLGATDGVEPVISVDFIRDIFFVPTTSQNGKIDLHISLLDATCPATHPMVSAVGSNSPLVKRVFEGDFILQVNDQETEGMTKDELMDLMGCTSGLLQSEESLSRTRMVKLTVMSSQPDGSFDTDDSQDLEQAGHSVEV